MKKVLATILILVFCLFCFVGCFPTNEDVCEQLNTLAQKKYSKLNLTVTSTTSNETLTSTYSIKRDIFGGYDINYSCEKLNGYSEVNGEIIAPTEYKSTVEGSFYAWDKSKISLQDNQNVNIQLEQLSISGLNFNIDYFSNIDEDAIWNNDFIADVNNIQGFLGYELSATNMKVEVSYNDFKIKSIKITYDTVDSHVKLAYKF